MNLEKIIYMAGIIDGEGSISISITKLKNYKYYQYSMQLNIINTNLDLMNWLSANFGGRIDKRKKIENRKQCYRWQICADKAAEILKLCLPYMIIKSPQAKLFLEFRTLMGKYGQIVTDEIREKRYQIAKKCSELNKFG